MWQWSLFQFPAMILCCMSTPTFCFSLQLSFPKKKRQNASTIQMQNLMVYDHSDGVSSFQMRKLTGAVHQENKQTFSDRGRWCVSSVASPSLSSVTPWSLSLCHCPNCPDRSLPSHFRHSWREKDRDGVEKRQSALYHYLSNKVYLTAAKTNV